MARDLMARARADTTVRSTLLAVCAHEGVTSIPELAEKKPELIDALHEMFSEMDADEQAMVDWADNWNPLQQGSI
jgi:hypothetical protein